jgi:hypothetical protein
MTSPAVWRCRCGKNGVDGPNGWLRHHSLAHEDMGGAGAHISLGFAPNYADGKRTSSPFNWSGAPRAIRREAAE